MNESLIQTFRELPFSLGTQQNETNGLSVLECTKIITIGQDLWTFFCTLVNFQQKLTYLVPMLKGFAYKLQEDFDGNFIQFLFVPESVQREFLETIKWSYINIKKKIVHKLGWEHRFKNINKLSCLFYKFKQFIMKYHSFEYRFWQLYCYSSDFVTFVKNVIESLNDLDFCKGCTRCKDEEQQIKETSDWFSTSESKSCQKRYLLFFRWIVRPEPDLGLWTFIPTSELLMPIDSSIKRVFGRCGIVQKDEGCYWNDVITITNFCKQAYPDDPIKLDFWISRLGIWETCNKDVEKSNCENCPLTKHCKGKKKQI